jgi:two-component system OmpR family sensor kinase
MSLRAGLLLAVGVVALLALLTADVVTYKELRSFLYNRTDQDLMQSAPHYVSEATGPDDNGTGPQPGGGPPQSGGPGFQVTLFGEVITPAGRTVQTMSQSYYQGTKWTPAISAGDITGFSAQPSGIEVTYFDTTSTTTGGPDFRVLAEKLPTGDILVVAQPSNDVGATLHTLERDEIIVSALALVAATLLGWWLVRRGLRPLVAMERTAESIADGDLDERVPGANESTEVGRLAGTLNVMLARIQQAFEQRDATEADLRATQERLRRFVADASHELRTPLSAVSAYAELFERGASSRPEDLERVLKGIRTETSRMGRLVEDLLLLARLDEGIPLSTGPVELVSLAADAVRTAAAVGPQWPVTLVAENPVEIVADGARLGQILDNFLANVRAHTPTGTTATVTVRTVGDMALIEVADNGPGFTEEQAGKVLERFYRTDASRSRAHGGAGLGLSIAVSIAAAHGGAVKAAPNPAGGALFTAFIPVAGPTPRENG